VVPGKRGARNVKRVVKDFAWRTDWKAPKLVTTDSYKPYEDALLAAYGQVQRVPRRFRCGRPPKPRLLPPRGMVYAAVRKYRRKGRVVRVSIHRIFGTESQLQAALRQSSVSQHINIAYVERYNATDRHLNARKGRKVYRFSKDPDLHDAATYLAQTVYNFCRANRALTIRREQGSGAVLIHRTPAMAQGITQQIWSIEQLVHYQACPRAPG